MFVKGLAVADAIMFGVVVSHYHCLRIDAFILQGRRN